MYLKTQNMENTLEMVKKKTKMATLREKVLMWKLPEAKIFFKLFSIAQHKLSLTLPQMSLFFVVAWIFVRTTFCSVYFLHHNVLGHQTNMTGFVLVYLHWLLFQATGTDHCNFAPISTNDVMLPSLWWNLLYFWQIKQWFLCFLCFLSPGNPQKIQKMKNVWL